jgi:RNA polymerase sigma factor (sigma-70 family)
VRLTWCVAGKPEEWVEGLRGCDPDVFDEVYDAYRGRIFGYLVRVTQRRPLAEDLLQETWLRVARSARALAPDSHLEAWLFRIAHNVFISHRRREALDLARVTELHRSTIAPFSPTPFDAQNSAELQGRLEARLARLDLRSREVLCLVAVEGLTPSEAAGVLQVSPATVRQRLKRARDKLAAALTDEESVAVGRMPGVGTRSQQGGSQ